MKFVVDFDEKTLFINNIEYWNVDCPFTWLLLNDIFNTLNKEGVTLIKIEDKQETERIDW